MVFEEEHADVVMSKTDLHQVKVYAWFWGDGISECILYHTNISGDKIYLMPFNEFCGLAYGLVKDRTYEVEQVSELMKRLATRPGYIAFWKGA